MASDQSKIHDLFNEALDRDAPEARAQFLDEACGNDSQLRQRLEVLLRAHSEAGGFFGGNSAAATATQIRPVTEQAGDLIGPYKLLQQIGEGGMGTVFMAEQTQPVERRVALKIIKPGMDTQQVIARFEAERQALAMMDHPNIAKVFEAGTTETGRPYFVMELVKGLPVTQYCDEHHLPSRERLKLFLVVCQAVQHAHQKGVIHRDLKPSNILVARYDDHAVPKVIDFGVAKAVSQKLTEKTMFTQYGQIVGTIEYMSPEQAQFNQIDVDTRSDVYALGVLLYELLTGETPFDKHRLQSAAFDEMLRIIREEEPPRPSARISTLNAEALSTISERHQVDPRKFSRSLRGELDWIVMKALEKDRDRRYESASMLAADVARYLHDEPVQACPPSLGRRVMKWSRRRRTVVYSTAVSLALVAVTAVSLLAYNHARLNTAYEGQTRVLGDLQESLTREKSQLYRNQIALAQRELESNKVNRARPLLEACSPELRGWEHDYLWGLCDRSLRTFRGHDSRIQDVCFSADGRHAASAGYDGTVRVWNVQSGQQETMFTGHEGIVLAVDFSPEGGLIACGGVKGAVHLWDTTTGELVRSLRDAGNFGHKGAVQCVAFSPDGKWIATSGDDAAIKLWDADTGGLLATLSSHRGSVYSLDFDSAGDRLVSGGFDKTVRVWNLRELQDATVLKPSLTLTGHEYGVKSVTFDPQGERIASGSFDNTIKLWDPGSGSELMTIRGHKHWVSSVAFDATGEKLVSACADCGCKVWDANSGKELTTLRGHLAPAMAAEFSPVDNLVISASWDRTLKLWNPETPADERTLTGHTGLINEVAFDYDGRRIASASFDGTVIIWNAATGRRRRVLDHQLSQQKTPIVWSVAFTPDGRRVVSGSDDGKLRVWVCETGELMAEFEYPLEVVSVAISPDGRLIAAGCGRRPLLNMFRPAEPFADSPMTVRNLETGELRSLDGPTRDVISVAFSPDGRWIAAASRDGICRIWEAVTGRLVSTFRGHSGEWITSIGFSPDGKQVLSCCVLSRDLEPGEIKLWDPQTGGEISTFVESSVPCRTADFSPDGRRIVATGLDSELMLIDAETGSNMLVLRGHKREAWCARFSPGGRSIVSGSYDQTLKIWEAPRFSAGRGEGAMR